MLMCVSKRAFTRIYSIMNLAEEGASELIDDNRRRHDRTTSFCPLSTNTHDVAARLRKQYRRSKKNVRRVCAWSKIDRE